MSQTLKKLNFNDREIILVGTAHVSKESCEEVSAAINEEKPDCVAIELDEQRYASLNDSESWRNLDIVKVLKEKKGFLLLANLVLSSFQRRMGTNLGVKPGDEMRAGIDTAKSLGIPCEMVDRPIQITLRRAWAKNSLFGKSNLLATLLASAFSKEEISHAQIEDLKKSNEMDGMMSELADNMPGVKTVLIDERDFYLASHIWQCKGNKILAVLGAGHLPGVEKNLEKLSSGELDSDTSEISQLPKKTVAGKIAAWIIPALIFALVVAGFVFGGMKKGSDMIGAWFLWNGILSGIGALLAGGHPLAILVSIVGAPFTSLCPFIGVGVLSGIVQAVVQKPKVSDLETVQDDVSSIKGFYKNRVLKVLLVFILSSFGSSVGTFVAGSSFVVAITGAIKSIVGK